MTGIRTHNSIKTLNYATLGQFDNLDPKLVSETYRPSRLNWATSKRSYRLQPESLKTAFYKISYQIWLQLWVQEVGTPRKRSLTNILTFWVEYNPICARNNCQVVWVAAYKVKEPRFKPSVLKCFLSLGSLKTPRTGQSKIAQFQ